jgi:hypothetical protein
MRMDGVIKTLFKRTSATRDTQPMPSADSVQVTHPLGTRYDRGERPSSSMHRMRVLAPSARQIDLTA